MDYTQFDAKLLALIASGVSTFIRLSGQLETLAIPFCKDVNKTPPWRVVDRRLQALRRSKKIIYLRTGWTLAEKG